MLGIWLIVICINFFFFNFRLNSVIVVLMLDLGVFWLLELEFRFWNLSFAVSIAWIIKLARCAKLARCGILCSITLELELWWVHVWIWNCDWVIDGLACRCFQFRAIFPLAWWVTWWWWRFTGKFSKFILWMGSLLSWIIFLISLCTWRVEVAGIELENSVPLSW